MTALELLALLSSKFAILSNKVEDGALQIEVDRGIIHPLMAHLHDELGFDYMEFMTALDIIAENRIIVCYRLFSYATKAGIFVRVSLDRNAPEIESVSMIYRTAEWHERETQEMFGVTFSNHPDPRKLLLTEDIAGFPLRKDFTHENLIRLPE